jgi:hypothetical protein
MFFISHFIKRTIQYIESEIKHCHGKWVYDLVVERREKNNKWTDCVARIEKTVVHCTQKIDSYLKDTK